MGDWNKNLRRLNSSVKLLYSDPPISVPFLQSWVDLVLILDGILIIRCLPKPGSYGITYLSVHDHHR